MSFPKFLLGVTVFLFGAIIIAAWLKKDNTQMQSEAPPTTEIVLDNSMQVTSVKQATNSVSSLVVNDDVSGLPDTDLVSGASACLSSWDILSGTPVSGDVLVYDDHGQHQGASTVDEIASGEANVELVTPDRHACAEMGSSNFPMYMRRFQNKGVVITPGYRLRRVEKDTDRLKVTFENEFGGGQFIERLADYVVVEHGTVPNDSLFHELRASSGNNGVTDYDTLLAGQPQPAVDGMSLFRVGDAVASRNIHAAILDSRRLCQTL